MLNIKKLAVILLVSTCSSAFAATVDFSVGTATGEFHCRVSHPKATISIDTHSVDINGGCAGRPFVKANGHLTGIPAEIANTYYFQVNKSRFTAGSVNIHASKGDIECGLGQGDKKQHYGDGVFCLSDARD